MGADHDDPVVPSGGPWIRCDRALPLVDLEVWTWDGDIFDIGSVDHVGDWMTRSEFSDVPTHWAVQQEPEDSSAVIED